MDKKVASRISEILEPTEDQKERMFINILGKHKDGITNKRGFSPVKRLRPALVAAVMAFCLITTTAFAAAHLGLDVKFLNFLNPSSDEQAEYLASGAYAVGKQVKNKNGILEIKQVMGDSNLTYILMDFTAPEGVVLNAERYRFDSSVDVNSYSGPYGTGFTKLEDENPNDNKISIIMALHTEKSLIGGNIKLKLKDLEAAGPLPKTFKEAAAADPEAQVFKTVVKGSWDTSFKLNFKDYSRTYEPNSKLMLYGYEATLQSVAVSPISITIKFSSPFTREIHEASPFEQVEYDTYLDEFPVTINYKDGSKETTRYFNGMMVGDYLSNTTFRIGAFESVINDKEIETIEFFDVVIPIDN